MMQSSYVLIFVVLLLFTILNLFWQEHGYLFVYALGNAA
jgi:hypothetical protein